MLNKFFFIVITILRNLDLKLKLNFYIYRLYLRRGEVAGGRKSPESSTTLSSCIAPWSVARFINSFLIIISLLTEQFSITLSCFETLIRPQVIVILSLLLMSFSLEHLYYTEEEIADSKAQVTAIHLIVRTLQRINVFGVENRDTLTHKATGYSARLLKKPDQCRAVYACSHLFSVDDLDGIKDGERALLCLRRALSIANAAQQMANATRGSSGPVTLFVEILNKYIYFYEKGNPRITPSDIQSLIELINTEMQSDNNGNTRTHSDPFFTSTLRYMRFQKQKGGLMGDKYELIKL
ncbi:BnaA02g17560D [Brassica napus]|uniref:BnaA02g17560D protein n=1 Tax=Brassica napus TaxID=3708 RepID=A0A078HMG1_BRANA|nr:BnaA02g17560D [Brassica napus]